MTTYTKDEYAAIGEMVIEAAAVDKALSILILHASSISEEGLSHQSLGAKLSSLEKCLPGHLRKDENRAIFAKMVTALRATNKRRDIVIHGVWEIEDTGTLNSAPLGSMMLNDSVRITSATLRGQRIEIEEVKEITRQYGEHRTSMLKLFMMAWGQDVADELLRHLPTVPPLTDLF